MFNELSGKTLTREQLVDWSISVGITSMTVEDIIYKALDARANITNLSKKYIEGMEQRMSEKKITEEKLLELCRKYGTDKAAESKIAEETGCAILTIRTYIHKWGIKTMIKTMEGKDITEVLKGVKGMEDKPAIICEVVEKPVMVIDDIALHKEDVQRLDEVKAKPDEVKPEEAPQQVPAEVRNKPTGKLKAKSLEGENYAYTVAERDRVVIINDLQAGTELEVPFDEFPTFAAEVSNFNYNYLRRFL